MFPKPNYTILSEITGFLKDYGEVNLQANFVFKEYKSDKWFVSHTVINNKDCLLVVFNKDCLVAYNYPLYIPRADCYTISELIWEETPWFEVLHQELIEYEFKHTLTLEKKSWDLHTLLEDSKKLKRIF
jgi:hypothetical protein